MAENNEICQTLNSVILATCTWEILEGIIGKSKSLMGSGLAM